ncbi:dTDP-4-dehydrorhamnose reductase [Marinobacterium sp. xm-a-152]|uniref:dTDP-4-dehydrorhamnose reductase n=1 Tax=Marinobacterium sp. xm-a-152 TaxID=2497733 RepID=UPI001569D2C3|nr:dTDP-4-dehydrorhamnose reductase [Marinobacterium sp. xm-a-152]NRP15190.1 dTDP-4-dehydrorhamnose reductase [Marinobacterium sp. xm-a-152]
MRILVTGGHGQVGSALAQLGKEQGLDLITLSRSELDITDAVSISRAFNKYHPDLLINAAAYTAVDKAESEPELAYAINAKGVGLLAEACATSNIPMLHISTDYVFDGTKATPYTEEDQVNPLSVYGKSKEAGESILREKLYQHIILRTSWVFGESGNNFVKTILRLAQERNELSVVSDQFGGPTSAASIAEVLINIALTSPKQLKNHWGTYHFCQSPFVSWFEFAAAIIENAKLLNCGYEFISIKQISSDEYAFKAKRPQNSRLSIEKLSRCFSIQKTNWDSSLKNFLDPVKKTNSVMKKKQPIRDAFS